MSNSCFCAANSFFRPLGLMVRGYDTSLQFCVLIDYFALQPASLTPIRQGTGRPGSFFGRFNLPLIPARSFQNYTDYFKCISAKGEDFAPCKQFRRAYHSLCPSTPSLKFISLNFCVNPTTTRWMGMLYLFSLPTPDLTGTFICRSKSGTTRGKMAPSLHL